MGVLWCPFRIAWHVRSSRPSPISCNVVFASNRNWKIQNQISTRQRSACRRFMLPDSLQNCGKTWQRTKDDQGHLKLSQPSIERETKWISAKDPQLRAPRGTSWLFPDQHALQMNSLAAWQFPDSSASSRQNADDVPVSTSPRFVDPCLVGK